MIKSTRHVRVCVKIDRSLLTLKNDDISFEDFERLDLVWGHLHDGVVIERRVCDLQPHLRLFLLLSELTLGTLRVKQ